MWRALIVLFPLLSTATVPTPHGAPYVPPPPEEPAAPSTPKTGTPTGPAVPAGPSTNPRPSAPGSPGTGGPGLGAATGTGNAGADSASWELWWQYNRDGFLRLKEHVQAVDVRTGEARDENGSNEVPGLDTSLELVVPALLSILTTERANDVVTSSMIALSRLADGPMETRAAEFARAFRPFAGDASQEVRETAVLARGLVGDVSSAFDLVALLTNAATARAANGDKEIATRTRAFAAYGLGFLAGRTDNPDVRKFVVHHLVNTLQADRGATSDVHVACVLALGLAPLSSRAASDARAPVEAATKDLVASTSREAQIECLLALASDPAGDRIVRGHVPSALARLSDGADASARAAITEALLAPLAPNSTEPNTVVHGSVLALGAVAEVEDVALANRARVTLQRLALTGERQARAFATLALAQRAARPSEPASASETREFLLKRLSEGRSQERAWAGLALGILEHGRKAPDEAGAASVRAGLLGALKDSASPEELGALAIANGLCRSEGAVPILLQKLERVSTAGVQGHLAVALGLIGDPRGLAPLREVLATARFRPELLREVAVGLALLEDHTLVPTLVDTLEMAQSQASQAAAAGVIGWIGDRRAVRPLLALATRSDATASARGFAIVALGRVCDRDRLPWNAWIATNVNYRAATATLVAGDGTGLLEIL